MAFAETTPSLKSSKKKKRQECYAIYQNYAFAKMVDRGGAKDISSGFERPIVIIGRDPLKGEVVNTVGEQNG